MKSYFQYLIEQLNFEFDKDMALTPNEKIILKNKLDEFVELVSNMHANKF